VKLRRGPRLKAVRSGPRGGLRLIACTIFGSLPGGLAAQTVPTAIPPTREEITRPVAPTAPPQSRLEVEGGIERSPCALDGPDFKSIHFVLRGAEFDGLQGLTRADLAAAYAPLIGQDVPISTVCEIRDRAATILRDAGYIAAVQVPEQRIEKGIVRFQVLIARLTQVLRSHAVNIEELSARQESAPFAGDRSSFTPSRSRCS